MEFVKNPKTNRPIRVGGLSWKKLVRDGLLNDDGDVISKRESDEEKEIAKMNEELPYDKHAVRGRGKYTGSIVERNKQLDTLDVVKKVSKVASKIVKEKIEHDPDDEDVEALFAELIMHEMIGNPVLKKLDMKRAKANPKVMKSGKFKIKEPSSESEEEGLNREYPESNDRDYD